MTDLATIAPGSVPGLIIEASHLAYDGIPLFQDLTLELRAGQWTGLLGPSGVGKSTLMRIAAGLDAGKGTYQATLSNGAPLKNSIALMAPQRDALLPWLSVLDNACLGARLREEPITERKDQAAALLTQVGLADYLDAAPVTLSGGHAPAGGTDPHADGRPPHRAVGRALCRARRPKPAQDAGPFI